MENVPLTYKSDSVSKSWFIVLNNPIEHYPDIANLTPNEICQYFADIWCTNENPERTGAFLYCESSKGLLHMHMVLEDTKAMRFSKIKKVFPTANIQATKGNKQQVEDYINKRGRFEEKGEKILDKVTVGEIKGKQGKRTDLNAIKQMIEDGLTPQQIIDSDANYLRLENFIDKLYYNKRLKETPFSRPNFVYWHFGSTGTGKSFVADTLVEKYGREHIHFTSATRKNPFDSYMSQKYLFIDELRENSPFFDFATILSICDNRTTELSARYHDKIMLWNEVHITSPLMPYEIYTYLSKHDELSQLYRRIDYYVYHYINSNSEYCTYIYNNIDNKLKVSREYIEYLASKSEKKKVETLPLVSTSIRDIIQRANENNILCNIIDDNINFENGQD